LSQSSDIVRQAAEVLRAGGLVAVPTETVYGLAADATNEAAVAKIFAAKGRPSGHPLIAHIAGVDWLGRWAKSPPALAYELGRKFWPGPLTIIVGRGDGIPPVVTGGRDTLALRAPASDLTRAIIEELGHPIAAPSANRFGSVSPTRAEHVRADLGDAVDLIVDGGPCTVGVESTIVDLTGERPAIARPGGVTRAQLEEVIGSPVEVRSHGEIAAPGTLASHYAPRAEVLLVASESELPEVVSRERRAGRRVGALCSRDAASRLPAEVVHQDFDLEPQKAAQQLYAGLRALDREGCEVIVAAEPKGPGMASAVADRLRRAAHRESDS
jgi:L-threonylcarbamoyladenylate synthase